MSDTAGLPDREKKQREGKDDHNEANIPQEEWPQRLVWGDQQAAQGIVTDTLSSVGFTNNSFARELPVPKLRNKDDPEGEEERRDPSEPPDPPRHVDNEETWSRSETTNSMSSPRPLTW
jgi:hypothetical protein